MKKYITIIFTVLFALNLTIPDSAFAKSKKIKDFKGAMDLMKNAYKIIKKHKKNPERAGQEFTKFVQKNKPKLETAFKKYYAAYNNGEGLTKEEKDWLEKESKAVGKILSDPAIKDTMEKDGFKKKGDEGKQLLQNIKSQAQQQ